MALSSNSLIHFTNSKEALIGILTDNFKIKYCLEKILTPTGSMSLAVPMVSFCDIPMSQIKEHIGKYGPYGIGLSQEWGRSKGLNPVLYIDKSSSVGSNYRSALQESISGKKISEFSDHEANLLDVARYMKNYEADLIRQGNLVKNNYRFADEKEWRYVPTREETQIFIAPGRYTQDGIKDKAAEMTSSLRLHFEPKDIKYVIINDDSEIADFINIMRTAKGKHYSYHDVERLMTRLTTVEQIMADF